MGTLRPNGWLSRMSRVSRAVSAAAAASWVLGTAGLVATSGCGSSGQYVWFQDMTPEVTAANREYLIGTGDTLSIRVLGHDEMTVHQIVRSDGRIAMLLIGEVEAKGKRPSALKAELEGRLKDYIVSPSVAVNVDLVPPFTVVCLGEVGRPGAYPVDQDPSVSHVLALAGGLSDYANRSSIFLVRPGQKPTRIRFTYESIYRNVGGAGEFPLNRGDFIEVE
jgi:protein involved in polysaccharide export with SLBB domain